MSVDSGTGDKFLRHRKVEIMEFFVMTDTGRMRSQNQDAAFATGEAIGGLPNLFLIADGMGGHRAGEYASGQAISIVRQQIAENQGTEPVRIMNQAITTANCRLYREAQRDSAKTGMGTTLVAASLMGESLCAANIGDSRLYIYGRNGLRQVTRDHSVVEEMVRKGEMRQADMRTHPRRNLITRAVGAEPEVRIDFFDETVRPGELLLLCTDGLTGMVEDEGIANILSQQLQMKDKVLALIDMANKNGGKDNITIILIDPFSDEVKAC